MITFNQLCDKFLAWNEIHNSAKTLENQKGYIKSYLLHLGDDADKPAEYMKPYQVNEWISSHSKDWGDNYKNAAVSGIIRIFDWGVDEGRIASNPVKKAFKPAKSSRKSFATEQDFVAILANIAYNDPFRDFVMAYWSGFARPQEIRHIEARHVDLVNCQINFPASESKGKKHPRCILILKDVYPIIERLVAKYPESKIFRNTRGEAWTKNAVCSRFKVISDKVGKKIIPYDIRHGRISAALEANIGHMDIAAAAGHRDGSMIGRVYSHVHENKNRLRSVFGG